MRIALPKNGTPMGCRDGDRPKHHTDEQLSALMVVMRLARRAGLCAETTFRSVPDAMRLEFNHSRWQFVSPFQRSDAP